MFDVRRPTASARWFVLLATWLLAVGVLSTTPQLSAQDGQLNVGHGSDALAEDGAGPIAAEVPDSPPAGGQQTEFNLLGLLLKGGVLMLPILAMSLLVITLVIERGLSLRERKILPRELIEQLGMLADTQQGFAPKEAYRICQDYPSSASTVIRAMLLKVGRPHSEVERAVSEASDREASRLYGNVRWLNLAAAVTPLMGLFGTVWGMIRAFFDTTQLTAGQNKADFLAAGIYVALVTTLGGLAVAIPAAICSHYFEGRIHNLFYRIDELLFNLLPQIERFEGRLRIHPDELDGQSQAAQQSGSATAPRPPMPRPAEGNAKGGRSKGPVKPKPTQP